MADATYNTPITQPTKTGIQVNSFTVVRSPLAASVTFDNLDAGGNIIDSFTFPIAPNDPSPTAMRDFAAALDTAVSGEPANALLRLNYRIIRYFISKGYITGATAV